MKNKKVINDIKADSKAFYRYAKKKSVIKSWIGPFNIKGKMVEDIKDMCNALSKQYEGVCSQPRELITDEKFIESLLNENNDYKLHRQRSIIIHSLMIFLSYRTRFKIALWVHIVSASLCINFQFFLFQLISTTLSS